MKNIKRVVVRKIKWIYKGPLLVSSGDRESHQEEYFPLLVRAGANITVEGMYVIRTDGTPDPVGAIFSMQNSQLLGHLAVAGAGSAQAIALAMSSTERRFARLQLKAENASVNLDTYTEAAIKQLAWRYLKGRQKLLRDKLWKGFSEERMEVEELEEDPNIDIPTLIRFIQSLEYDMDEPEDTRLFITSPADFEADDQQM